MFLKPIKGEKVNKAPQKDIRFITNIGNITENA